MHYYKVAPLLLLVGPLDLCMTHEWTLHMSVESKRVAKLQSLSGNYYYEVVSRHCSGEDDIGSHRWGVVASTTWM